MVRRMLCDGDFIENAVMWRENFLESVIFFDVIDTNA